MKHQPSRSSAANTTANVAKKLKAAIEAFTRKRSVEDSKAPAAPKKDLVFLGTSRADLQDMPDEVKDEAGYQLLDVQYGETPPSSKVMATVGPGVRELVVNESNGWFRVMYVATFADTVYVLHCFQKKTNKTPGQDIKLGKERFALINKKPPKAKPK